MGRCISLSPNDYDEQCRSLGDLLPELRRHGSVTLVHQPPGNSGIYHPYSDLLDGAEQGGCVCSTDGEHCLHCTWSPSTALSPHAVMPPRQYDQWLDNIQDCSLSSYDSSTPATEEECGRSARCAKLWVGNLCEEHKVYLLVHASASYLMQDPAWPTRLGNLQCDGPARCLFRLGRLQMARLRIQVQHDPASHASCPLHTPCLTLPHMMGPDQAQGVLGAYMARVR